MIATILILLVVACVIHLSLTYYIDIRLTRLEKEWKAHSHDALGIMITRLEDKQIMLTERIEALEETATLIADGHINDRIKALEEQVEKLTEEGGF